MQLYSGSSKQFIEDATQNRIAGKLKAAFLEHFRYEVPDGELRSWHNSLSRMKDVVSRAGLTDHGILLEYQLPLTSKRLDFLIAGKNAEMAENAVIVELKQWDGSESTDGPNEVITWLGDGNRCTLHPSVQVGQYATYLRDAHTAFYEGVPIGLDACAYLHNYHLNERDPLKAPKFRTALLEFPLFSADDVDPLCSYLTERLQKGDGMPVLARIQNSKYRASKKLLEHVSAVIKAEPAYTLLDEQLVVYDQVYSAALSAAKTGKKTVFLIQGGPGTGKSVIALNLMADLSKKEFNCHYATGSKAFTSVLQQVVGSRASQQFKYFFNYVDVKPDELDVLILDESHRIRKSSVYRFSKKDKRSGLSQIEEIVRAAKTSVFFIDDLQGIRPDEVGSSDLIRATANSLRCELKEYKLEAQFRCEGSDAFVSWVDNTLDLRKTANILWSKNEKFDFRIFDSPESVEQAIRIKSAAGAIARMTAGFCWPWSDPKPGGTLVEDVVIGTYQRAWNAKPDTGRLAKGIPKANVWAHDPRGIDQIGCIYTAQGFDFDYAGVIFGKDLIYDPKTASWQGQPAESADSQVKRGKDKFTELVKRTYRVLFSRAMKGCYVFFQDENTRNFFLSRMEGAVVESAPKRVEAVEEPHGLAPISDIAPDARYVSHLPVYNLAAAASGFSEEQSARPLGWIRAEIGRNLTKDMYVVRVRGRSMEPTIRDGSWCVFRKDPGGSRNGKIVLVQSRLISDPEDGGRFTVKRYTSEIEHFDDGTWRHKQITLSPLNSEYSSIVLRNVDAAEFRVAGEFVACLSAA